MTKEEFKNKYSNITRCEKLPFVSWCQFVNGTKVDFMVKYKLYSLRIGYMNSKYVIRLYLNYETIKDWDLTEDNYYKVYEECRKLFIGEKINENQDK